MPPFFMPITINLEPELWAAVQEKALSQQMTLDKAMNQLLHLGLIAETSALGQRRFTFSLPGGVVTSEEVNAVLEEII